MLFDRRVLLGFAVQYSLHLHAQPVLFLNALINDKQALTAFAADFKEAHVPILRQLCEMFKNEKDSTTGILRVICGILVACQESFDTMELELILPKLCSVQSSEETAMASCLLIILASSIFDAYGIDKLRDSFLRILASPQPEFLLMIGIDSYSSQAFRIQSEIQKQLGLTVSLSPKIYQLLQKVFNTDIFSKQRLFESAVILVSLAKKVAYIKIV